MRNIILTKYFIVFPENGINAGNHPTIVTASKDRRKFNQKVRDDSNYPLKCYDDNCIFCVELCTAFNRRA